MKKLCGITVAFVLGALTTPQAGGWAVTTVEDLPARVVAGEPVTLTFSIRQHGVRLLDALQPQVDAVGPDMHALEVAALRTRTTGYYTATFTLPAPGQWTFTIYNNFGGSPPLRLRPFDVAAPGAPAAPPPPASVRGAHLYDAKGCVTCHGDAHADGDNTRATHGPSLIDKRYEASFLRRFLADPAMRRTEASTPFPMPDLNLRSHEIDALVAYLTAPAASR